MRLHPSDDNVSDAARLPKTKLDASVKTDRLRFCPLFNQDLQDDRRFLIAGWGRRAAAYLRSTRFVPPLGI